MAKRGGSCLGTLLKIILGIVITAVVLVVGAYLVLKFAFGIDAIDLYKKYGALKNYDETKIITSPYASTDLNSAADKLEAGGLSFLVERDGENVTINLDAKFGDSMGTPDQWEDLFGADLKLSGPELAAVINNVMRGMTDFADFEIAGLNVNDMDFQLKQIKFENLLLDEDTGFATVDLNIVCSIDLKEIKKLIEEKGFGFANRFLPDKLYVGSITTITQTGDCNYTVAHKGVGLNNLDSQGTKELFDLIGGFVDGFPKLEEMNKPIGEMFANILIGNSENPIGFAYLLSQPQVDDPMYANASKLATGFTFEEVDGVINFVIKHNPNAGQI